MRPLESELRCKPAKMTIAREEKEKPVKRKLRGCHLYQVYPPEAFRPGVEMSVRIFEDKKRKKSSELPLDPDLVSRIWADFRPWFEARKENGAATPVEAPPDPEALAQDFTSEFASFESTD